MSFVIRQGLFLLDIADHYAVLGLPVDAGSKVVRKAYLKIAQRLHPDTCKIKNETERQLASDLLSKLVNPAYEKLSKQGSWSEFQVVLKQLSRQLAQNKDGTLKLQSAIAQDLSQNLAELELEYNKKVREIAQSNYKDVNAVLENIATLSELNLVFLKHNVQAETGLLSKTTGASKSTSSSVASNVPLSGTRPSASGKPATPQPDTTTPAKTTISSSFEAALWRGEQHLLKKNFAKAALEFREAIKLDPNSVRAHALMGMSYLQQKQLAMAKVHIKKAYVAKPSDPTARKAKQLLEKAMGTTMQSKSKSKPATRNNKKAGTEKKGGLFGGLFGGKKQ